MLLRVAMNTHERFMQRALELAERGAGFVYRENPLVGAVVVKENEIIAEGFHQRYGGPHAEACALEATGAKAKDADLYVTLEPCAHYDKKTPPCVDKIISSGVKRVFIAMRDPNPKVNGRGVQKLKEAKIEVIEGILEKQARKLNEIYIKYITTGRPFVLLKMAMSADGKIATVTGDSKWISSEESLKLAHELRNRFMAWWWGLTRCSKMTRS
jgi:diaminohydroxyphosphoribosylaminopyrimidine deaminase/5-amino-6-(5-phosphoribosylamino)uracil reductase